VTSSALDTSDAVNSAIENLVLPAACTARLSPSQIDNMKTNVVFANQAMETAGNAIRGTAECLHLIKSDVKNKNWTALTDSGALNMSGRMARDLVKAYESWLGDSDVPDAALAKVSARMLARIGSVRDAGKRNHAINKMKRGEGFTEQDLGKKKKVAEELNAKMPKILTNIQTSLISAFKSRLEYFCKSPAQFPDTQVLSAIKQFINQGLIQTGE